MAVAMIGPKFYAWDRNGKPLSFGKLYTYEARTNSPKPTYQSEDQVVENTNPVILNGEGYANVFLSGRYKMVLKDKNENEIWSSDPVSSNMADEWVNCATAEYLTSTSFKLTGNYTDSYETDKKIRLDSNAVNYDYTAILSSSYGGGFTTVITKDPVVRTGLSQTCVSIVGPNSTFSQSDLGGYTDYSSSSIQDMRDGKTTNGEIVSLLPGQKWTTGATTWKVVQTQTKYAIAAGSLFVTALNGIWVSDARAFINGVDDDQPAVQYCVDLKAGAVMLGTGDYKFNSEVIYYTRSVIRGIEKEQVTIRHPNCAVAFKSESFNVQNTDTTRFEIGRMTIIGGWDSRVATSNLVPQSAIFAKGYDYDIHNLDIEQYGDVGIYATSTEPTSLIQANEHIESYIRYIKASKCYNGGVFLESPTDSFIKDVVVISLGDQDWGDDNYSATNYGVKTGAGAGATIISDGHCYGYMQYTYNIGGGSTRMYDCIGEGGITAQVYVGVDGVQISRGRYFSGYKADGTSIRAVNQGIVVAENVKDCKFETDIFFCNEGGVVFLGAGSGGKNIVNSVIFATSNGGAAATPAQIVGATNFTDTISLRYQQGAGTSVPSGVAPQLTTNGAENSTFGQLTLGSASQTKTGDNNIFSISRNGTGSFVISFVRPYSTNQYITSFSALTDHYVKVVSKATNSITIETKTLPGYALSDDAIIDLTIMGFVV